MKHHYLISIGLATWFTSITSYALPFSIIPQGTLPATVVKGKTVHALYTVTNSTSAVRVNNFVKWFPPNVKQLTDPTNPNICGTTFNLGPIGSINQSCTLKLEVSGAVNRADPSPQHHLFVCFPGGKTCAGPTPQNSLDVKEVNEPPVVTTISTAVGGFGTDTTANPLVYISSDNGMTWPTAVLPSAVGISDFRSILFGVGCNGKLCSAIGNYFTNDNQVRPISYSSSDSGASWSAVTIFSINGIPLINNDNRIIAVSCADTKCTAVGYSSPSDGEPVPLAYASSNNGVTWSEPNLLSVAALPPFNQGARLGAVSCSGTNCNAVGFYYDGMDQYQPVSYYSTDNGVSWSSAVFPPVPGFASAKLTGVSCVGNTCTAVGRATDPLNMQVSLPISYISTDAGHSWSQPSVLSFSSLPLGNNGVNLNGVSCAGTRCVAVGIYYSATFDPLPISYTSTNSGVTWSGISLMPMNALPADVQRASVFSISCIGTNCSAVGNYLDAGNNMQPLTYYSADNGISWIAVFPSISSIPGALSGGLFGVGGAESGNLQT